MDLLCLESPLNAFAFVLIELSIRLITALAHQEEQPTLEVIRMPHDPEHASAPKAQEYGAHEREGEGEEAEKEEEVEGKGKEAEGGEEQEHGEKKHKREEKWQEGKLGNFRAP